MFKEVQVILDNLTDCWLKNITNHFLNLLGYFSFGCFDLKISHLIHLQSFHLNSYPNVQGAPLPQDACKKPTYIPEITGYFEHHCDTIYRAF